MEKPSNQLHTKKYSTGSTLCQVYNPVILFWSPLVHSFYTRDIPRDVRNLVINTTSYHSGSGDRKGILLEFGVQWDDIDPVVVIVDVENASENKSDEWWYEPGCKIYYFDTSKVIKYDQTSDVGFFGGQKIVNPPTFTYYSIGTPLSPTNSLYLWYESHEQLIINSLVFDGKHYHIENGQAVLDKRR